MAMLPPDPKYMLRGDMSSISSLMFRVNPYIEHLYAGTIKGFIHIWDLAKNREIYKIQSGTDPCLAMHMKNLEDFISHQKCGVINFWKSRRSKWDLDHQVDTEVLSFCRSELLTEDLLVIPHKDSEIGIMSLKDYKVDIELNPLEDSNLEDVGCIMAVKGFPSDKNFLFALYENGLLTLWDIRAKKIVSSVQLGTPGICFDFDMAYMKGIMGNDSEKLHTFAMSKSHAMTRGPELRIMNPGTSAVAVRNDSKICALANWDGRIRVLSWKTLRQLAVLDVHKETLNHVIFSSEKLQSLDNRYIMAAGGKEGHISLYNIYN